MLIHHDSSVQSQKKLAKMACDDEMDIITSSPCFFEWLLF